MGKDLEGKFEPPPTNKDFVPAVRPASQPARPGTVSATVRGHALRVGATVDAGKRALDETPTPTQEYTGPAPGKKTPDGEGTSNTELIIEPAAEAVRYEGALEETDIVVKDAPTEKNPEAMLEDIETALQESGLYPGIQRKGPSSKKRTSISGDIIIMLANGILEDLTAEKTVLAEILELRNEACYLAYRAADLQSQIGALDADLKEIKDWLDELPQKIATDLNAALRQYGIPGVRRMLHAIHAMEAKLNEMSPLRQKIALVTKNSLSKPRKILSVLQLDKAAKALGKEKYERVYVEDFYGLDDLSIPDTVPVGINLSQLI